MAMKIVLGLVLISALHCCSAPSANSKVSSLDADFEELFKADSESGRVDAVNRREPMYGAGDVQKESSNFREEYDKHEQKRQPAKVRDQDSSGKRSTVKESRLQASQKRSPGPAKATDDDSAYEDDLSEVETSNLLGIDAQNGKRAPATRDDLYDEDEATSHAEDVEIDQNNARTASRRSGNDHDVEEVKRAPTAEENVELVEKNENADDHSEARLSTQRRRPTPPFPPGKREPTSEVVEKSQNEDDKSETHLSSQRRRPFPQGPHSGKREPTSEFVEKNENVDDNSEAHLSAQRIRKGPTPPPGKREPKRPEVCRKNPRLCERIRVSAR